MPKELEDLSDERLEQIVNSKMVQKYLCYEELASGIESLKEDDVMFNQLVNGIEERYGRVSTETIESVLDAFVEEVQTNTTALEKADKDEDESVHVG